MNKNHIFNTINKINLIHKRIKRNKNQNLKHKSQKYNNEK
jgi:hypothetical protein